MTSSTDTYHAATYSHTERLGTSLYGNPYFRVHFLDADPVRTQIDTSISYSVNNHRRGDRVLYKVTRAGRMWDLIADAPIAR